MTASYDAAKRPTKLAFGTPGWLEQAFDRDGNVAWEDRSLTVTGGSGDSVSNRQTFGYDGLNRLTGSTGLGVPRRYTYVWFNATKPGTYRLTCAEYCGTAHAQMACLKEDTES